MAARPLNLQATDDWINQARTAEQAGETGRAQSIYDDAVRACPDQAILLNAAANFAMRRGDTRKAEPLFARARQHGATNKEYATNHAIALNALGRPREAIAALETVRAIGEADPKYCSTRATSERAVGDSHAAARWYDRALAINPALVKALHGRARVALERGEPDAPQRFDQALAVNQGEADLWLGKAQALDVAGRHDEARNLAEQLVTQAPQWEHGTRFLAQLRLAAGDENYTSHYADAARKVPQDPNIRADWAELLAGLDQFEEAASVLTEARRDFPDTERFTLLEAIHAGSAGNYDRAEALFAQYSVQDGERKMHEARHRIRGGEYDHALALLDDSIANDPLNIGAWAMRGVAWRLTDDPRAEWLHEQVGLVQFLPLVNAEHVLADVVSLLHELHDNSPLPLGQSLRGGTQTRGILFARREPALAALHRSLNDTLKNYRAGLPETDPSHPLLRHHDADWSLAGSWSVQLSGGGDFHTSHIHPQGIISSALYCEVPTADPNDLLAGVLEIGRPPPDLRIDLPPLRTIEPKPGHLALFPSTLYHGTRPFAAGRRMSVAFDIVPQDGVLL